MDRINLCARWDVLAIVHNKEFSTRVVICVDDHRVLSPCAGGVEGGKKNEARCTVIYPHVAFISINGIYNLVR